MRRDGTSRLFEAGHTIEQVSLVTGHCDWRMLGRSVQRRQQDLRRDRIWSENGY